VVVCLGGGTVEGAVDGEVEVGGAVVVVTFGWARPMVVDVVVVGGVVVLLGWRVTTV
jgi:hypothetical protein